MTVCAAEARPRHASVPVMSPGSAPAPKGPKPQCPRPQFGGGVPRSLPPLQGNVSTAEASVAKAEEASVAKAEDRTFFEEEISESTPPPSIANLALPELDDVEDMDPLAPFDRPVVLDAHRKALAIPVFSTLLVRRA